MLTDKEFGQIMTALTHGASFNVSEMPYVSLRAIFEVLRNYTDGTLTFEIGGGKVSWRVVPTKVASGPQDNEPKPQKEGSDAG